MGDSISAAYPRKRPGRARRIWVNRKESRRLGWLRMIGMELDLAYKAANVRQVLQLYIPIVCAAFPISLIKRVKLSTIGWYDLSRHCL